jgi:hypothetical protein
LLGIPSLFLPRPIRQKRPKSRNEKVWPATNAEWVKHEIPPPKEVPKSRKADWKWKGGKEAYCEKVFGATACFHCNNGIEVYYQARTVGGKCLNHVKYVQRPSKLSKRYVDVIPFTLDRKRFLDMGYEINLEAGDDFETYYEKHFADITCAMCSKVVYRDYWHVYMQDGEKGGRMVVHLTPRRANN